jgi:hypothetical protein
MHDEILGYRLAGHTIFTLKNGKQAARFDTMYMGRFFEQYFMIISADEAGQAAVHHHSLPAFVPLAEILPHFATDVNRVFRRISDYLNAYVARREQVWAVGRYFVLADKRAQMRLVNDLAAPFLQGDLLCSVSIDYVSFEFRDAGPSCLFL